MPKMFLRKHLIDLNFVKYSKQQLFCNKVSPEITRISAKSLKHYYRKDIPQPRIGNGRETSVQREWIKIGRGPTGLNQVPEYLFRFPGVHNYGQNLHLGTTTGAYERISAIDFFYQAGPGGLLHFLLDGTFRYFSGYLFCFRRIVQVFLLPALRSKVHTELHPLPHPSGSRRA